MSLCNNEQDKYFAHQTENKSIQGDNIVLPY